MKWSQERAGQGPDPTQVFTGSLWLCMGNRLGVWGKSGEPREEAAAIIQVGEGGQDQGRGSGGSKKWSDLAYTYS